MASTARLGIDARMTKSLAAPKLTSGSSASITSASTTWRERANRQDRDADEAASSTKNSAWRARSRKAAAPPAPDGPASRDAARVEREIRRHDQPHDRGRDPDARMCELERARASRCAGPKQRERHDAERRERRAQCHAPRSGWAASARGAARGARIRESHGHPAARARDSVPRRAASSWTNIDSARPTIPGVS